MSDSVLVAYGSKHGMTAEIAERIGKVRLALPPAVGWPRLFLFLVIVTRGDPLGTA